MGRERVETLGGRENLNRTILCMICVLLREGRRDPRSLEGSREVMGLQGERHRPPSPTPYSPACQCPFVAFFWVFLNDTSVCQIYRTVGPAGQICDRSDLPHFQPDRNVRCCFQYFVYTMYTQSQTDISSVL